MYNNLLNYDRQFFEKCSYFVVIRYYLYDIHLNLICKRY